MFHLTPTISVTFDTWDDVPGSLQPNEYGFVTNSSTIVYNDNGSVFPYAFSYLSILPNNKAGDWALIRENNTNGLKVFQYNPTTLKWVRTYPESIETPVITPDRYRGLTTILQTNSPEVDPDFIGTNIGFIDEDALAAYLTSESITPVAGNVTKVSGIFLYYTGTVWEVATDYLISQIAYPVIGDYAQIRITPTSQAVTYFYGTSWVAVPQEGRPKLKTKNATYTFQLSDAGFVYKRTSGSGAITWTIPANSSVEFDLRSELYLINSASGSITVALTTDTLELNGVGVVASFTIPQYASAYLVKTSTTTWFAELRHIAADATHDGYLTQTDWATFNAKQSKVSTTTDNAIVRFDGTTGNQQNSGVLLDDNNCLYGFAPKVVIYTASHTLDSTDCGKLVVFDSASDVTCTLPVNTTTYFGCMVQRKGAGNVTFAANSNTISIESGHTKIAVQGGAVNIAYLSTGVVSIAGRTA